jgi:O-antigen/teichoic acid export membrane protein
VKNKLAKNTLYLTLAAVGQKVIAFAYFLVLARIMAPELTGEYHLATSIIIIFSVVADFGITPVVIREIAKTPERTKSLVRHAIGMKIPLILIGMIAAVVTGAILDYSAQVQGLIALATIVLLLDALHLLFYGVLRGMQVLKYESVGVFIGQLTTVTIGGLSLWLNPSLEPLVVALIGGSTMNLIVSGSRVIKNFGWGILVPSYTVKDLKWLMATALPFALAAIFVKVYSYVDTLFISKMLDASSVGIYALAYKLTYAFQFLPLAFIAALYPNLSEQLQKDTNEVQSTLMTSFWYMALVSAPIVFGISAIAPELVQLAGGEYEASAIVLQTLVLVLIPIFLDFPVGSLLNASGRQSIKTSIYGMTMVINVLLNFIFIPKYEVMGAAYAALGSFTFLLLAGMYFVPKIVKGFSWVRFIKTLAPIYLSGLLMFIVVTVLKPHLGWMLIIPVGAIVYIASLLSTGSLKLSDLKQLRRI